MGKRGPKPGFNPKTRISEQWRPELAYAIGLLASDGCLFPHGHLIDLTSKDREQLINFSRCIGWNPKIGRKASSLRIQVKSVLFYEFLARVGLTPAKSKTIGALNIPRKYFFDFLRGLFDGDGSTYSYWDPRWRSSFMYYLAFASASSRFIAWLQTEIKRYVGARGHVSRSPKRACSQLRYAKKEALVVIRAMYNSSPNPIFLSRKRLKIEKMLAIVGEQL